MSGGLLTLAVLRLLKRLLARPPNEISAEECPENSGLLCRFRVTPQHAP